MQILAVNVEYYGNNHKKAALLACSNKQSVWTLNKHNNILILIHSLASLIAEKENKQGYIQGGNSGAATYLF